MVSISGRGGSCCAGQLTGLTITGAAGGSEAGATGGAAATTVGQAGGAAGGAAEITSWKLPGIFSYIILQVLYNYLLM